MTDKQIVDWAKKQVGTAGWEQKLVNLIRKLEKDRDKKHQEAAMYQHKIGQTGIVV